MEKLATPQENAPIFAAARECVEEIGVKPTALYPMLEFIPVPGSSDEHAFMYLGTIDAARIPERAGAASSLIGIVQQTVAATTGTLVAQALGATAWPLVIGIAVPGVLTLVIWAATRAARARGGSGRAR